MLNNTRNNCRGVIDNMEKGKTMKPKLTLNNFIFIKLDPENTSVRLKNGCELFVDNTFEPEKHFTVTGEVYGLPSHLSYSGKPNLNMPWETDMEIRMHDKVIFYYLSVVNALKPATKRYIIEGNDKYVFIEYQYIYAVVRDDKIIPINGYCLIEPVEDPSITQERERMAKIGMEIVVLTRRLSNQVVYGKVKYVGIPNRNYVDEGVTDRGADVEVGDVVVIRKTYDVPLQYSLHQKVNDGVKLFRVQRRNLLAKI